MRDKHNFCPHKIYSVLGHLSAYLVKHFLVLFLTLNYVQAYHICGSGDVQRKM